MKKLLQITTIILLLSNNIFSQEKKISVHTNLQNELIFSFPYVSQVSENISNQLRMSIWLHINKVVHIDFTDKLGLMTGIGMRNIGFTTVESYNINEENYFHTGMNLTDVKTKRRAYSLGIPLSLKIGSFKKHFFLFAGGEYELLFHYKQKQFIDGNKYKRTKYFSKRTNLIQPSLLFGLQFPKGRQIKLKYYFNDFLNQNYSYNGVYPYLGMKTKLIYISLSLYLPENQIKKSINETIAMRK